MAHFKTWPFDEDEPSTSESKDWAVHQCNPSIGAGYVVMGKQNASKAPWNKKYDDVVYIHKDEIESVIWALRKAKKAMSR